MSPAWERDAVFLGPPHGSASVPASFHNNQVSRPCGAASPPGAPTQVNSVGFTCCALAHLFFDAPVFSSYRSGLSSCKPPEKNAGGGADMDVAGERTSSRRREGARNPAATTRRKTPVLVAYALGVVCLQGRLRACLRSIYLYFPTNYHHHYYYYYYYYSRAALVIQN